MNEGRLARPDIPEYLPQVLSTTPHNVKSLQGNTHRNYYILLHTTTPNIFASGMNHLTEITTLSTQQFCIFTTLVKPTLHLTCWTHLFKLNPKQSFRSHPVPALNYDALRPPTETLTKHNCSCPQLQNHSLHHPSGM